MINQFSIKKAREPYEGFVTLDNPVFPEDQARNAEFAQAANVPTLVSPKVATDYDPHTTYDPNPIVVTGHTPKQIIASGGRLGRISIDDNPAANGDMPLREIPFFQKVTENEKNIAYSAKKYGVDPDLLRSIIWMETTHGYYDSLFQPFDLNKSILPMNINTEYWGNAWGSRKDLKDSAKNIAAGARMLRAISRAMPNADIASKATIYNHTNASKVSDYGRRVQKIYEEKPWRN